MSTQPGHNANHTPEWNVANDYARAQSYPEAVTHGSAAVARAIAATRDAYNAGQTRAAGQGTPNWLEAAAYASDRAPKGSNYYTALRRAYIDGWNATKAAQPHRTYWQAELSRVITQHDNGTTEIGARLKIDGADGSSTKWLYITPTQFDKLAAYLLTIEGITD